MRFLAIPRKRGKMPASFRLPGHGQAAGHWNHSPCPPQQVPSPEVFSHISPFSVGLREFILS